MPPALAHALAEAGPLDNSVRRHHPHRDAGTGKQAEREDRRADKHPGPRRGTWLHHASQDSTRLVGERSPTGVRDLHPDHDLFSTTDIGDDRPPLGKPVHRQRGELPN
jgi:hypothetical protein